MGLDWKRLAAGAPTTIVAAIAALSVAAEFGRFPYLELATHFRLQYALAASLAAVALLAAKRWKPLAAAVLCAAVNWASVFPYLAPITPTASAATEASHVRIMLANVYMRNRAYETFRSEERRVGKECKSGWTPEQ